MKKIYLIFLIAGCALLFGCGKSSVSINGTTLNEAAFSPEQASTQSPTVTVSTQEVDPLMRPSATLGTVVVQEDDTATGTPTEIPTTICSPLGEHDLSILENIVSDPYAPPPDGGDERHHGVDFAYYRDGIRVSIEGEGVMSILDGRVSYVQTDRLPYGNMVIIETNVEQLPEDVVVLLGLTKGQSLYHLYAHLLDVPKVGMGDWVKCGEQIGQVGKTGYNIVNSHLHLEIRVGPEGAVFYPMAFYDTRATREEQASYLLWRTSGLFRHQDPMKLFDFALCTNPQNSK